MLINIKMPTIVGILTFMSMINFVLSRVGHDKKFYNLEARFSPDVAAILKPKIRGNCHWPSLSFFFHNLYLLTFL